MPFFCRPPFLATMAGWTVPDDNGGRLWTPIPTHVAGSNVRTTAAALIAVRVGVRIACCPRSGPLWPDCDATGACCCWMIHHHAVHGVRWSAADGAAALVLMRCVFAKTVRLSIFRQSVDE